MKSSYDYIVVGAGATGSVIGGELSKTGADVRDDDGWGVPGWTFKDVLPMFKAQEDWEAGKNLTLLTETNVAKIVIEGDRAEMIIEDRR